MLPGLIAPEALFRKCVESVPQTTFALLCPYRILSVPATFACIVAEMSEPFFQEKSSDERQIPCIRNERGRLCARDVKIGKARTGSSKFTGCEE